MTSNQSSQKKPMKSRDWRINSTNNQNNKTKILAYSFGGIVLLIVAILIFIESYNKFILPPKTLASRVGNVTFTMGDLVKRIRTQQAALRYRGQFVDLSTVPFQILFQMTQDQLIIQKASKEFGISVSEEEIDIVVKSRFFPDDNDTTENKEERTQDQLEKEFKENYTLFLDSSRLDEQELRQILKEEIFRNKLRTILGNQIPDKPLSIEVLWIILDQETSPKNANTIQKMIRESDFRTAVFEYQGSKTIKHGFEGWVPKGAFLSLDEKLFGTDEKGTGALKIGEISEPILEAEGLYIIEVLGPPSEHEITMVIKERLKSTLLKKWTDMKWNEATNNNANELEVNFDSDLYAWVAREVKESRARFTPVPIRTNQE